METSPGNAVFPEMFFYRKTCGIEKYKSHAAAAEKESWSEMTPIIGKIHKNRA